MGGIDFLIRKKRSKYRTEKTFNVFTILSFTLLILYAVTFLTLLLWAFTTSFKANSEYRLNKLFLPKNWVWNYGTVFKQFYVFVTTDAGREKVFLDKMFLYALAYAFGCAFFNTLVPCITAYMCAKFRYAFSGIVHTVVIVTMIIPIVGSLPSEVQMAKNFGLYNHIFGLWIMKANFLGMYFLRQGFPSFPA